MLSALALALPLAARLAPSGLPIPVFPPAVAPPVAVVQPVGGPVNVRPWMPKPVPVPAKPPNPR